MQKQRAISLNEYAHSLAANYSRNDRDNNFNQETFLVKSVEPLSETTAAVWMEKHPGGKWALFFCYYLNFKGGTWRHIVPTDSHVLGMENLRDRLAAVERHNFPLNFPE